MGNPSPFGKPQSFIHMVSKSISIYIVITNGKAMLNY